MAGGLEGLGEFRQVRGDFAGEFGGVARGIERGGIGPEEAEACADLWVGEIGEPDTEGARVGKRQAGFAGLGEVGEQLEAVAHVHHDDERRVGFVGRQGADVALGLAAGFEHGVVPRAGAADGLGGFLLREDASVSGGEFEWRGGGAGFLKLLGFEDEVGALVEVNAALDGGAVGVMLRHGKLEEVTGAGVVVGWRDFEQVAEFEQEALGVGTFGRTGGRPVGDEIRHIPLRHGVELHERGGRGNDGVARGATWGKPAGSDWLTRINHKLMKAFRRSADFQSAVSQASNLRGVAAASTVCRLEVGDTAGWKPALRAAGRRMRWKVCDLSGPRGVQHPPAKEAPCHGLTAP